MPLTSARRPEAAKPRDITRISGHSTDIDLQALSWPGAAAWTTGTNTVFSGITGHIGP